MSTVREPSYRKRIGYHAGLLWAMAAICSAALVIAYKATDEDIKLRQREDMQATLQQVIPARLYDNDILSDKLDIPLDGHVMAGKAMITVYRASKHNKLTGFAYQVTGLGYAGPIEIMLGVDTSGRILGTRVISHSETPGLGDKIEIKKDDWIELFNGLSLGAPSTEKWKVKKDGGQFDQFTGATITPRAVIKAVRQGLEFFQQHRTELVHIDNKTSVQK